MEISLKTTGDKVVIENFQKIAKKAENTRPTFGKIADLMLKSHNKNFQQQGSRFGSKWANRKKSYPWPILKKTGKLSKSFKSSYDSQSATVENTATYAKWHQSGTRKMTARPIAGWDTSDLNEIVRTIRKDLMEV